jgi:hypothetical protein
MAEEQTQEQAPDLSIQDLASLKQIIDVASQRGAFKPGEMAQVGQTYNKLEAFLNEIQRQQSAQQEAGKGKTDATAVEETPQGE